MDLAKKLQLTGGVELINAPEGVGAGLPSGADAVLVFVRDRAEVDAVAGRVVEAASVDRLTWVAYPKAGKLGTDLNRDSLAGILTALGVQPVRQIAIDEVWSALRFRPA